MLTVFERIPDDFLRIYDVQLQVWARNFRKIGRVGAVRLVKPVSAEMMGLKPTAHRAQITGVRLKAEVDRAVPGQERMIVSPQTDEDAEAIAAHIVDLRLSKALLH